MPTILNARAFGADNTGTSNASTAINAALAALPSRGGIVQVPAGTYLIDAKVNVNGTTTKSVILQGDGENATVFKPAANNVAPMVELQANSIASGIEFDGTGKTGINGVRFNSSQSLLSNFILRAIDGRAIDMNDSADGGLYFNVVRNGRIMSSCGYGIWIATTVAGINSVNDNRFYDISITSCTGDGIRINKGNGNKFIGVDIEDCTGFGVNIQDGQDNYFLQWLEDNTAGNLLIIRDVLNRGNQFWGRGDEEYASQVDTTGAITSGTASLSVASATNIVKGKYLKVVGAGAAAADLYAYVTAISGTTITLNTNASTTVGPAAVVTGPELADGQHLIYHSQRFTHFIEGQVVLETVQLGQKGKSSSSLVESYGGMTLYPPGGGNTAQYLLRMDSTLPDVRFTDGGTVRFVVDRAGDIFLTTAAKAYRFDSTAGIGWFRGAGSPENAVTAPIGSLYSRSDGGGATSLYVKESGSGNTGWVAK